MAFEVWELHHSNEHYWTCKIKSIFVGWSWKKVNDVYNSLAGDGNKYVHTKQKLSAYFSPKQNVHYHIDLFRKVVQPPDKHLDNYHTRQRF